MRAVSRNSEERAIAGIDVVQGVKVSIGSISICESSRNMAGENRGETHKQW